VPSPLQSGLLTLFQAGPTAHPGVVPRAHETAPSLPGRGRSY
jgi:hypothetical protein